MPAWSFVLFIGALVWALWWTWRAWHDRSVLAVLVGWGALHAALAGAGFYMVTEALPPRPMLLLLPMLLAVVGLLVFASGRRYLQKADLLALTVLHVLRIPVELVLHAGWQEGLLPRMLTYEGMNFDIISGLTAPLVVLYLRRSRDPGRLLPLLWNVACLLLLVNVVVRAALSFPSPMQVLNHDEPMRLVQQLPWIWLPSVIVPAVLLAHVAAIVKLIAPSPTRPATHQRA
ncbi:MAG: hypothetical protein KDB95_10080 [Flavobacteriales bacterium]|nr:hypothetical protein [Flavobacteriales bacterium]